jgi:hypothetical protein
MNMHLSLLAAQYDIAKALHLMTMIIFYFSIIYIFLQPASRQNIMVQNFADYVNKHFLRFANINMRLLHR